jgi:hypothetical protein
MHYNNDVDSGYYIGAGGAGLKDFGYSNGWRDTPAEVSRCKDSGHVMYYKSAGRCVTEYGCPICGFKFYVDSSD